VKADFSSSEVDIPRTNAFNPTLSDEATTNPVPVKNLLAPTNSVAAAKLQEPVNTPGLH